MNYERFCEYYHMQVWEKQGSSFLGFGSGEGKSMGRTVENDHLSAALYDQLRENDNVEFIFGDPIEKTEKGNGVMKVTLESGRELETRLLVGSDGNNSQVKKLSGIPTFGWSHNQKAIVCTVKTDVATLSLWQRFLGTGPLAVLSMWGNYSSIVWSVSESYYEHLMQISDEAFRDELNSVLMSPSEDGSSLIQAYLGNSPKVNPPYIEEICNKRLSFPLNTLSAQSFVQDNLALIGDAAHSIHPMAGQGLNLGLLDSEILANTVCKALNDGRDFALQDVLFEYEKYAKLNNYTMQGGLEVIKTAYSLNSKPVSFLRNLGVDIVQNTPLNGLFQEAASGKFYKDGRNYWRS